MGRGNTMRTLFAALAMLAGCYAPAIPNGTQACTSDRRCADGYQCATDNRCYLIGQLPGGDASVPDLAGGDLAGRDLAGGADLARGPDLATACTNDSNCPTSAPRC